MMILDPRRIKAPAGRKSPGDIHYLIDSIRDEGQHNPILVTEDFTLIHGVRRLDACVALKTTIKAQTMRRSEIDARLREVDAILKNNQGTALEQCIAARDRKFLDEGIYPGIRRALRPGELYTGPQTASVTLAELTKKSVNTVERMVFVGRFLTDEVIEMLRGTPLENNQIALHEIAHVEPPAQLRIARKNIDTLGSGYKRTMPAVAAARAVAASAPAPTAVRPKVKGLRRPEREADRVADVLAMVTRAKGGFTALCNEWDGEQRADMIFAINEKKRVASVLDEAIGILKGIVETCKQGG